jgi:hypothetical protein
LAEASAKVAHIVDGGEYIVLDDVLGDKLVDALAQGLLSGLVAFELEKLAQHGKTHFFIDAERQDIEPEEIGGVHHAVGNHLDF